MDKFKFILLIQLDSLALLFCSRIFGVDRIRGGSGELFRFVAFSQCHPNIQRVTFRRIEAGIHQFINFCQCGMIIMVIFYGNNIYICWLL